MWGLYLASTSIVVSGVSDVFDDGAFLGRGTFTVTAIALLLGTFAIQVQRFRRSSTKRRLCRDPDVHTPPQVPYFIPFLGSAIEFQQDCRAFVEKYRDSFDGTALFSALIAGNTFHFVTTTEFPITAIFRNEAKLSFPSVGNQVVMRAFGWRRDLLDKIIKNPGDMFSPGDPRVVNMMHKYLQEQSELQVFTEKAQEIMFREAIPAFVCGMSNSEGNLTVGLYEFCWRILWRATVGSIISDDPKRISSYDDCGVHFRTFDADFAKLVGGAPPFLFKRAIQGREHLVSTMAQRTSAFETNKSRLVKARHELFPNELDVTDPVDMARADTALLWASVANTVPTGFWTLFHLTRDQEALLAVRHELDKIGKSSDRDEDTMIFSVDELQSMKCLDSVVQETLRMYSESILARDVVDDFVFEMKLSGGGTKKFWLEKGSRVVVLSSVLHYDEDVFLNPTTFVWNRFLPDPSTGAKPTFRKNGKPLAQPVRPFGGGTSMCPGRKFAINEIKAFVATMVHEYDVEFVVPDIPPPEPDTSRVGLGICVPVDDVSVRIRLRFQAR